MTLSLRRILAAPAAATLLAAVLAAALPAPAAAASPIKVVVDPRVELVSIVFHLAGNPEYGQGRVPAYVKAVDAHFAAFRDHAVVERARRLRETRGIGFDAPMKLAVCLDAIEALRLRPGRSGFPLTEDGDDRWTPADAEAFLADLRAFARDAAVPAFLDSQRSLFEAARASLETAVASSGIPDWLGSFFGGPSGDADLYACVGLLNGGPCYGPSARPAGGRDECWSILGTPGDAEGRPSYPSQMIGVAAHEFVHSYANRLIDANLERLRPAGEKLFAAVKPAMERQAYGTARTVLCESLVRACVSRYLRASRGEAAADADVKGNVKSSFLWTPGLVSLLGEYESSRDRHPDLGSFMPRVVAFFEGYAANDLQGVLAEKARREREIREKSPKIVSVVPADGAKDVDPALAAVVVTFDRPMVTGNLAVLYVDAAFPGDPKGKTAFDPTGRILTIPAKLKPGTDYGFGLNGEGYMTMKDLEGNFLAPVLVRFRTK